MKEDLFVTPLARLSFFCGRCTCGLLKSHWLNNRSRQSLAFGFYDYHVIYYVGGRYGGISSLNVSVCLWIVPIMASSGRLKWWVSLHGKHKASVTWYYHCICLLWLMGRWQWILPTWLEIYPSKGCTINPVSCIWVATACRLCSRLHSCSLHFPLRCLSLVSLSWPLLVCAVFSVSPNRMRLFPIAAVDKKLSGISRQPFPAKMKKGPKMDWLYHIRSNFTYNEKSMLSMLWKWKIAYLLVHQYWVMSMFGSPKPKFKLQHSSVCYSVLWSDLISGCRLRK